MPNPKEMAAHQSMAGTEVIQAIDLYLEGHHSGLAEAVILAGLADSGWVEAGTVVVEVETVEREAEMELGHYRFLVETL